MEHRGTTKLEKYSKYTTLVKRLAEIIHSARANAVRQINKAQVLAYYEIGREIVEFEQKGKARAEYGKELIKRLSKDMTDKFGKGFSERNLRNIRAFYLNLPIWQTVSAKSLKSETVSRKSSSQQTPSVEFNPELSWSHYCELLSVENPLARSFYEKEAGENDPIGLILCAKKNEIFAKYVLGNLNNKIFASKYKLALPTEKELSRKIRSLHLLEGQDGT